VILIKFSTREALNFAGYTEQIQALANNPIWADQVKISKLQELVLFYIFTKVGENKSANKAVTNNTMYEPHDGGVTDISIFYIELAIIPYSTNQPVNLQLWNSNLCLISLIY